MTRNRMISVVALLIIAIVGAGAGYWGIKKWKKKQNQEFKYEVKYPKPATGFDAEKFKQALLSDEVCQSIAAEHGLEAFWSCDAATAQETLRKKCTIRTDVEFIYISYQDKDQAKASSLLKAIAMSFHQRSKGTWKPYGS